MLANLSRRVRSLTLQFHSSLSLCNERRCRCLSSQNAGAPKQPLSRYMAFVKEERQKFLGMPVPELGKVLGQKWKEMSDEQKEAYNPSYEAQMEKYKEEKKLYLESLPEETRAQLKTQASEKRKQKNKAKLKKLATSLGKPKSPCNAYGLFVSQQLSLAPATSLQDGKAKLTGVAEEWKKMTGTDKQQYEAEASKRKEQYKLEMDRWEKEMLEAGYPQLIRKMNVPKPVSGTVSKKKAKTTEDKGKAKKKSAPAK